MSTVKTDAQFMERFENFAFKEVVEEESVALETNTRYLAILASLVGSQGLDAYKFILQRCLIVLKKGPRHKLRSLENI